MLQKTVKLTLALVAIFAATAGGAAARPVAASWRHLLRSPDSPLPPWMRRGRPATARPWRGLARPEHWHMEPPAPGAVDQERFGEAFHRLCRTESALSWAKLIHREARRFKVDPFLVGAALFRQNRCRLSPALKLSREQARITHRTHQRHIHDGGYHYFLLKGGAWQPQRLGVDAFPFTPGALLRPGPQIYFTAAVLAVYSRQCQDLDSAVRSKTHRSPVSHLFWGDRVLGSRFEDEVLRARRRLLSYYTRSQGPSTSYRGVTLVSPLDGAPRVISSAFRAPRDGGRRHGGVDFFSTYGEPVRAVADGQVVFAGVAPPGRGVLNVSPRRSRAVPASRMGRGGLFVLVEHTGGLKTGYYHLSRFTVARGTRIKARQLIGFVGRSGIKESPSHLHFEVRLRGRRINPARPFSALLVKPWRHLPRRKKHLASR